MPYSTKCSGNSSYNFTSEFTWGPGDMYNWLQYYAAAGGEDLTFFRNYRKSLNQN